MYEDWFADWLVTYIHENNAILIAPNYRLLPESSGPDMFEDVADFWTWMRQSLQPFLSMKKSVDLFGPGIVADFDKVLVAGESAGGTLAVMSCMSTRGIIKACIATYPGMLDYESEQFHAGIGNRRPFGAALLHPSVFHDHVAAMVPGKIITSCNPPGRSKILIVQNQYGLLGPYFGDDESHYPLKLIEKVKDTKDGKVPYMLIIHGKDDSVCDLEMSELFVEKGIKNLGKGRLDLVVQPGDHGFDTELPLKTKWLREALKKPTSIWLGDAKL